MDQVFAYRTVTFILVFLLLGAGCVKRQTPVALGDAAGVLHFGNGSEPQELDPHIVTGVPEHNIISALLEGLVGEDPQTLVPVPAAAERWDVSPDQRTYTFHLRAGAVWSNGDPVTAGDFAYAYARMLSPQLGASYADMLYILEGAEAYHKGEMQDFSSVGVQVLDAQTLVLRLRAPASYFLSMLSHYAWFPVHPPTIEAFEAQARRGTGWTKPGNYVGNGPFALDAWRQGDRIVVSRRTNYWDAARVKLQEIHFHAIGDAKTEQRAFEAEQLHVTGTVEPQAIEAYRRRGSGLLRVAPYLGTYYYVFNTTVPPLDKPEVRRALSMAISREQIVTLLTKAGERAAHHFTPPGTGGYTATARIEEDAEAARELLAAAGYPGGAGFPTMTLLYNNSEAHQKIAEVVRNMWEQQLGIQVELTSMEWAVYLDHVRSGKHQIARASWIADYNDPNTFLDMWLTGGGNNRARWSSETYDRLIRQAAGTGDPDGRESAFQEAEALLLQESPIMPIYFYVSKSLIQPSVRGWYDNVLDHHPWKHIWLEPVQ
jgi:oligopeptide transport system substrate-binding protein